MAIKRLTGGGLWTPAINDEVSHALGAANYVLDASGEIAAIIFRAPKAGTIVGAALNIGAVSNAPDNGIKVGRQGIGATGLNDGSYVSSVTSSAGTPSATGWFDPGDWDTPQVVAHKELVCVVVSHNSFTAGDNFSIANIVLASDLCFPYSISATNTKQGTYLPCIFPRYSDGSYAYISREHYAATTLTNTNLINSGSTPDEYALAMRFPWRVEIGQLCIQMTAAAGADYDLIIYDAADRVVASASHDADILSTNSTQRWHQQPITPAVLERDQLYRIAWKPTTTNNSTVFWQTFQDGPTMDTMDGGRDWFMSTRVNGGAWTDYNNSTNGWRRFRAAVLITGIDDGAVTPRTRALRRPA